MGLTTVLGALQATLQNWLVSKGRGCSGVDGNGPHGGTGMPWIAGEGRGLDRVVRGVRMWRSG